MFFLHGSTRSGALLKLTRSCGDQPIPEYQKYQFTSRRPWRGLENTGSVRAGNARKGKLLACFALAPKSLNFKGTFTTEGKLLAERGGLSFSPLGTLTETASGFAAVPAAA